MKEAKHMRMSLALKMFHASDDETSVRSSSKTRFKLESQTAYSKKKTVYSPCIYAKFEYISVN